MAENEENQAKNTNRFPSPLLPKGKSVAQCFNYCWVYFQLMRIQHLLEPRLESKGLRQGLEDPLQGCHTHIIWCLNWTIQLQTPVLLHLLQGHGCFFPASVLSNAQICVAGWGSPAKMSLPEPRNPGQERTQGREMGNRAAGISCCCAQPRCRQWSPCAAQVPAPKAGVLVDKGQKKAEKRLTGMELLPWCNLMWFPLATLEYLLFVRIGCIQDLFIVASPSWQNKVKSSNLSTFSYLNLF